MIPPSDPARARAPRSAPQRPTRSAPRPTSSAAARTPAPRWSRSAATAARELAPYSDLDVVLVSDEGVELARAGRAGLVPALGLRRPARPLGADAAARWWRPPTADLQGRPRAARPAPPRRRPEPDPAAADHDAGALAAAAPASGCPALRELVRSRHDLVGELAHLSVPDLKEAEGGLRDATVLKALVATWLVDVPHVELERDPAGAARRPRRGPARWPGARPTGSRPELWSDVATGLGLAGRARPPRCTCASSAGGSPTSPA